MKVATLVKKHKNSDSNIKYANVTITPDTAPEFLDGLNLHNRKIRSADVKQYMLDFLTGNWTQENGETLIYGEFANATGEVEESIISAQHRLVALIKAGEAYNEDPDSWPDAVLELRTGVIYGVDGATADSEGLGRSRNHTDVLFRNELLNEWLPENWNSSAARRQKWANTLATATRVVWQRQNGKTVASGQKFTTTEMLAFLDEHPELHRFVTMVLDAKDGDGGNGGFKISLAYIAALTYLTCLEVADDGVTPVVNEDIEDNVCVWLDHVAQGSGFDKNTPAHAITGFWNKLQSRPGSKDRDLDITGPLVKCLTALANGEEITAAKVKLTKKEVDSYKEYPPVLPGWDTACFEYQADLKLQEEREAEEAAAIEVIEEMPDGTVVPDPEELAQADAEAAMVGEYDD